MTCYLTDDTDPDDVERGFREGVFTGVKLYPANATTNSAAGVTDYAKIRPVLARMEKIGMRFLMHGEVTDPDVDIFDREAVFVEKRLAPLAERVSGAQIILEHLSSKVGADFVRAHAPQVGGTITPYHLELTAPTGWAGAQPYMYVMPVIKTETDRLALRKAATSGEACYSSAPTGAAPGCRSFRSTASRHLQCAGGDGDLRQGVRGGERAREARGLRLAQRAEHYGLPPNEETITLGAQALGGARGGQGRWGRTSARWSTSAARRCNGRWWRSASIRLGARHADHLAPFGGLGLHEGGELLAEAVPGSEPSSRMCAITRESSGPFAASSASRATTARASSPARRSRPTRTHRSRQGLAPPWSADRATRRPPAPALAERAHLAGIDLRQLAGRRSKNICT